MENSSSEATDPRILQLAAEDNVGVTKTTIEQGERLAIAGAMVVLAERIPTGHKLAVAAIPAGAKVIKYGAAIGSATRDIKPGEYVHTHNVKSDYLPTFSRSGFPA